MSIDHVLNKSKDINLVQECRKFKTYFDIFREEEPQHGQGAACQSISESTFTTVAIEESTYMYYEEKLKNSIFFVQ